MRLKVLVTRDKEHMSKVAANILLGEFARFIPTEEQAFYSIGLPTGSTPEDMYGMIARRQDEFDARQVDYGIDFPL